uniref:Uncharacterized protein n=1 Tax=Panagrolaimus sp. PS1159 TaxID=55785 RepID=A0AC35EUU4_9BILA
METRSSLKTPKKRTYTQPIRKTPSKKTKNPVPAKENATDKNADEGNEINAGELADAITGDKDNIINPEIAASGGQDTPTLVPQTADSIVSLGVSELYFVRIPRAEYEALKQGSAELTLAEEEYKLLYQSVHQASLDVAAATRTYTELQEQIIAAIADFEYANSQLGGAYSALKRSILALKEAEEETKNAAMTCQRVKMGESLSQLKAICADKLSCLMSQITEVVIETLQTMQLIL